MILVLSQDAVGFGNLVIDTVTRELLDADPRILVRAEQMRDAVEGGAEPFMCVRELRKGIVGSVIVVRSKHGVLIYRVAGYDAPRDCWVLEWPD